MDEFLFQRRAEQALTELITALGGASERHGFEADFNAGALTIEFEGPPGKFVVSPNSPVRQIWVSANVKSYKLDWDESRNAFVLSSTGQSLVELMGAAIGEYLGEEVQL